MFYAALILFGMYGWTWKVVVASLTAPGLAMLFLSRLAPEQISARATPTEGIRRSGRNGLVIGLATTLVLAAGLGVPFGPAFGLQAGIVVGLFAWMFYGGGAFLFHYTQRAGLARRHAIPWRYQSFLDDMADRLLLRRSGSAYLFIHLLLRDHLARPDFPAAAQEGQPTTS